MTGQVHHGPGVAQALVDRVGVDPRLVAVKVDVINGNLCCHALHRGPPQRYPLHSFAVHIIHQNSVPPSMLMTAPVR